MNSYLLQDNGKDSESLKDENEAKEKEKTNKQATRNREVLGAKQNILIEYIFKITHESAHVPTITSLVNVKPASAVEKKKKKEHLLHYSTEKNPMLEKPFLEMRITELSSSSFRTTTINYFLNFIPPKQSVSQKTIAFFVLRWINILCIWKLEAKMLAYFIDDIIYSYFAKKMNFIPRLLVI